MTKKRVLSLLIPVFNEEKALPELFKVIDKLKLSLDESLEIIFCNDGSSDQSKKLLDKYFSENSDTKVIHLTRNFGQQAAFSAALCHATGDLVAMMDADLQDNPFYLSEFIKTFDEGYEVVYAIRSERNENIFLRSCYFLFYRIINFFSDIPIPLDSGDFCLISSRVAKELRDLPEVHRYLRGMRAWLGYSQKGVVVKRDRRIAGDSKYSIKKLVGLASNGLLSFSLWPLRFALFSGAATIVLASLFLLYTLAMWLISDDLPTGFTALSTLIIIFGGFQMILLGIVGEYLGRVFQQVKGRPQYIIESISTP